ncbi:hypothetical protein [Curtobacterium sp. MCPF17_031]|uniref:hypothetical protein n=1 Tax=Curtobacterium sp. MCPF17_031 TaxID=2175653 RepID=UPI0011B5B921|nr:hypothetical protein [Curtobacterium sp. MCPF17_031]
MPQWLQDLLQDIGRRELTVDGASLLASLYAAGIIAAGIEVRALAKVGRHRLPGGIHDRASGGAIATMAFPAFLSIPPLAQSVAMGVPLRGGWAVAVTASGYLMFLGLIPLVIEFVALARQTDRTEPPRAQAQEVVLVGDRRPGRLKKPRPFGSRAPRLRSRRPR